MAKKRRAQIASKVVDFAADALVETVVASVSYAVEIRAQMIEDFDKLKRFWQQDDDEEKEDE